ncbi:MAG: ribbon-helix-helix domain-containing protein [Ruminococcus sp.]|nr:ribbon-helix-helix domain-containing protein [Ruminococcus sp.]
MSNFVPKQYKKDPITIRIDYEKLERIDKLAQEYNLSRSEFINQCINFALDNMTDIEKQADEN